MHSAVQSFHDGTKGREHGEARGTLPAHVHDLKERRNEASNAGSELMIYKVLIAELLGGEFNTFRIACDGAKITFSS
ncbi:hypothetical protein QCE62_15810 [Caballeronia sp. LZ033]|nr:hypothetical protein [Caballeronia sp. LZ033]